ncbi:MAG TPA: Rossmann-like and DUF2520 domain-containing protein [Fusobacterium sp.]|uniref:Rossmann-like and DUF2520 domain-containing protein n=1 Tax=Fusobacterium sp. TaxID=68766 RepID=UPI002F42B370
MYKIGIIGAGKVGTSLGRYFSQLKTCQIVGYYSKTIESAEFAAKLTDSQVFPNLDSILQESNFLMIATPDDVISEIWKALAERKIKGKIICHCSGSLSSDIFLNAKNYGIFVCSLHPLMAIYDKTKSFVKLHSAFFTMEGDQVAVDSWKSILEEAGNSYKILSQKDKRAYHAASVFISNFVIALGNIAIKLLSSCDFTEKETLQALSILARENLTTFLKQGSIDSLTGPVERNDLGTLQKHLSFFQEKGEIEIEILYRLLSLELSNIAQEKNPNRNYQLLQNILKENERYEEYCTDISRSKKEGK